MSLLSVKNLTKKYQDKLAVDHVQFECLPEKCVALLGPNGAGKTTILRILAGLIKPTDGVIHFSGMNESDDLRSFIGYLPQYPVFHSWMTGFEFLVYSGKLSFLSKAEARDRAHELLDKVGISDAKNKKIGKYSGGMKQRLGIAQAIIHRPKLLLLDEPVSSLDPIGRRDVLKLMEELKQEMSILFSTHILTDADEISDELLLLHHGKIVESGSLHELRMNYQTTNIELSFVDNQLKYQEKLNVLESVRHVEVDKEKLRVTVSNTSIARKEILALATKEDWPLTHFSVSRVSLEDLFMKVVNE